MGREAELVAQRRGLNDVLAVVQLAKGTALLAAARHDEAFAELRRLFDPDDPSFHARDRFGGLALLVDAGLASGRRAEVLHELRDLERVAVVTSSPILHAHLAYAHAMIEPVPTGQVETALPEVLDDWPWLRARLGFTIGAAPTDAGDVARGAAMSDAAAATMRAIGAEVWIAR